jgi:tripartite-type tricarboxylate transporter receptor subunit TctC
MRSLRQRLKTRVPLALRATLPCACVALLLIPASAHAQPAYPAKPVRFIVPFPPGGSTDVLGRIVASKLGESLGQQIVVDNRGGAGGVIGTDLVVRAPPDGHTLLFSASAPLAINVTLMKNVPYDPRKDLTAVTRVASVPLVLVVHPSVPVRSMKELIALLRARPKDFTYASAGSGTPQHLSGELLKSLTNVSMTHVPYKGSGPAMIDVISGQVPITFEVFITALSYVKSGRLRALAQTGTTRSPHLSDVPTIAETGVRAYESIGWYGLLAPAGVSRAIVDRLHSDMARIMATPDMQQRLAELGADPVKETPEQFAAFIRSEIVKWAKVIHASGAKAE